MQIDSITNDIFPGYPAAQEIFGWPGAKLTITGNGFGQSSTGFVGIKMGAKIIALKPITWSDTKITFQVPDNTPSRLYYLGIFQPPPLNFKTKPEIKGSIIFTPPPSPKLSPLRTINPQPVPDPLKGSKLLSNTIPFFIALGAFSDTFWGKTMAYFAQLSGYRIKYGFEEGWEKGYMTSQWAAFSDVFIHYKTFDKEEMLVNYIYDKEGPGLAQPFSTEKYHMELLEKLLTLSFPGEIYKFKVVFGEIPPDAPQQPFSTIVGCMKAIPGEAGDLGADWMTIHVFSDTTIIHEFAHRLGTYHHYPPQPYSTIFPGETCVMNKTIGFCRGCCMAMGLDWNQVTQNEPAISKIIDELSPHFMKYPYL